MEDQAQEPADATVVVGGSFSDQLTRLRDFRERMRLAGAVPKPEQFAVRKLEPVLRRSLSVSAQTDT